MNNIAQQGNWSFELKQVFCRKVTAYGQPYVASAVITVTDGKAFVELLTNKENDTFSRDDFKELKNFINKLGFEKVHFSRFNNNQKREAEY